MAKSRQLAALLCCPTGFKYSNLYSECKAHRVALANKPLFITEFGVKGPEDFQAFWLQEAGAVLHAQRDKVAGACYFNLYDNPDVWGEGIPAPDWSVEAERF